MDINFDFSTANFQPGERKLEMTAMLNGSEVLLALPYDVLEAISGAPVADSSLDALEQSLDFLKQIVLAFIGGQETFSLH